MALSRPQARPVLQGRIPKRPLLIGLAATVELAGANGGAGARGGQG